MKEIFRLSFGKPESGWIVVNISGEFGTHEIDASDVPCDSLSMLAEALLNFIDGKQGFVEWSLEPGFEKWVFNPKDDPSLTLLNSCDQEIAKIVAPIGEICRTVWRALLKLESYDLWNDVDSEKKYWSHSFPHSLIGRLGNRLKQVGGEG